MTTTIIPAQPSCQSVTWRVGLLWAIAAFVSLRFLFTIAAFALAALAPLYPPCTAAATPTTLHDQGLALPLFGAWQRADGCTYEWIAAVGYSAADPYRHAFFPLYPLALHLFSPLVGNNFTLSGFVVSGLAYIAGTTGLYCLATRDFTTPIARRAILYLSIFPSAFFFFAPFTEALFLALTVWALYSARRAWWLWAGALGLLAAFTRTQGLLLALPLGWEAWRYCRQQQHREWRAFWPLVIVAGPIGGFLLYNSYTWLTAGMTVMQIQHDWGMRTAAPWTVITDSWQHIVTRGSPIEATNLFLLLVCTIMTIAGVRRVPGSYTLVCVPQLLLLVTREMYHSPLMSVSRLLVVVFPVFIILAIYGQRPWFHRAWLTTSFLLLVMLLVFFLGGPFVA